MTTLEELLNRRAGSFDFVGMWKGVVQALGETGMGYTVVRITLVDGAVYPQVVICGGCLSRVRGIANIPFTEDDISSIRQTDERWDWNEVP
jgi:hypothetical protein